MAGSVAIFSYSSSLAHAGRAVTIGRSLQVGGCRVTLVGTPRYLESSLLVDRGEFPLAVVGEPTLDQALAGARGGAAPPEELVMAGALHDDLRVLAELSPDVVVVDNRRSALLAAELVGVPSLSLTNASLLGSRCAIDPTAAEVATICAPATGRHPDEVMAAAERDGLGPGDPMPVQAVPMPQPLAELLRLSGALPRRTVEELSFGTRTMVLDLPELHPVRDLPEGAASVGPVLFDVSAAPPPWWGRLEPGPLIYCTFGSTGQQAAFAHAIEQLVGLGAQVVVTTADIVADVPPGVLACRYLASSKVMRRASLVVCHGGSLTMYQALAHGVPILAVPTHLEQALEVVPLVRAGVARVLGKDRVHPGSRELAELARRMMTDQGLRERAAALAPRVSSQRALSACVAAAMGLLQPR